MLRRSLVWRSIASSRVPTARRLHIWHGGASAHAVNSSHSSTRISGCVRTKVTVPLASSETRRRLKPTLSKDKFATLTAAFFARVEAAVAPLQPPTNADFCLETTARAFVYGLVICARGTDALSLCLSPATALTINANARVFELTIDSRKQQLLFTSPISGLRTYAWNQRTQRWEDETDAHDVEGLLTRDLMRICSGVPSF